MKTDDVDACHAALRSLGRALETGLDDYSALAAVAQARDALASVHVPGEAQGAKPTPLDLASASAA